MYRPNAELKRIAREQLNGRYSLPIAATLLVSLLPSLLMLPFSALLTDTASLMQTVLYYLAYFIILVLSVVLSTGQLYLHLNLAKGRAFSLKDLIFCFKNRPDAYILAFLLYLLYLSPFLIVGALALLVPYFLLGNTGLIFGILLYALVMIFAVAFAFYYALVFLLLLKNPGQKLRAVFAESRRLMTGNRKRFFLLILSFLGYYLLGILSLGIGLLWVNPYLIQSQIVFYLDLTGELADPSVQSSFAQP